MKRTWEAMRAEHGPQDKGPDLASLVRAQKRRDARCEPAIRCRNCGHSVGDKARQVAVDRCVLCYGEGGGDGALSGGAGDCGGG
jgi:hypothetical protein